MLPSLHAFLHEQDLEQYYDAFIRAGATDRDVLQLLHLNDSELNEFLNAVRMLPFHAVILKKGLREQRSRLHREQQERELSPPAHRQRAGGLDLILNTIEDTPTTSASSIASSSSSSTDTASNASRDVIICHATIYGKNSRRALTKYESAINEAAVALALENPSLLVNKGDLFEQAKRRLLASGYQYKRGRSRSKLITPVTTHTPYPSCRDHPTAATATTIHTRRTQNAQRLSQERQERMDELQVKIRAVVERQQQHPNEMAQLEPTRLALVKQVSKLKAKERKHQWYERRKTAERSDSGFSEESGHDASSLPDQSQDDDPDDDVVVMDSPPPPLPPQPPSALSPGNNTTTAAAAAAIHHPPYPQSRESAVRAAPSPSSSSTLDPCHHSLPPAPAVV